MIPMWSHVLKMSNLLEVVHQDIILGIDSSTATRSSSSDSLTIARIGHITCSVETRNVGLGSVGFSNDIAMLIEFYLTGKEVGVGFVTNGKEETVDGKLLASLFISAFEFTMLAPSTPFSP